MHTLKNRLAGIDAGKWLDVAVGRGEFLKFALGSFRSWKCVTGIDISKESLQKAKELFENDPVILLQGSALSMPFINDYFDTITMSNALHHIEDIRTLFTETSRICKKKGLLIINEMLNEDLSDVQESYMIYHKFISDIDNQQGIYHRDTYTLKEMLNMIKSDNFQLLDYFIHAEVTGDIMNKDEIEIMARRLKDKISALRGTDFYYFYENKSKEIINRFYKTGINRPRHITFLLQIP